jgi:hypothetical protein
VNPLDKNKVAMDKPMVAYLEEILVNMRNLIGDTVNREVEFVTILCNSLQNKIIAS